MAAVMDPRRQARVSALEQLKPRAMDIYRQMGADLYKRAYEEGMGLSAWLENEDPSEEYKDGIDGFSRMCEMAGIRTMSDVDRGIYANKFEEFLRDEQTRALIPEWAHRTWRRAATGHDVSTFAPEASRIPYTADMLPLNSIFRPYADAAAARYQQLAPAIPLSELVAINTPIDTDSYRSFYLTEPTADQKRFVRIGEAAEVPEVLLTGSEHYINIYKYGRAIRTTYEAMRRQRIDLVALHIARMAIQAEADKVLVALDVLINGDGNAGTAATNYNLTTLDSAATPGTLTLKGWLNFKMAFPNPYSLTSILGQSAAILQTQLLNTGNANVPLVQIAPQSGFGGFRPINPQLADTVAYGITPDAPANKIVGIDRRFGLERVFEVGSNIQEVERYVRNQTQVLVMTEVEGYGIFDANATKILTLNA